MCTPHFPDPFPLSFGPAVPGASHNPTFGEERGEDTCNDMGRGQTLGNSLVCDFVEYVMLLSIVKHDRNGPDTPMLPVHGTDKLPPAAPPPHAWHSPRHSTTGSEVGASSELSWPSAEHTARPHTSYPHRSAVYSGTLVVLRFRPPRHHCRLYLPSPILCTS